MRKILIVLTILLITFIVALPTLATRSGEYALRQENRQESWSSGVIYWAGKINLRYWRYEEARALFQAGLQAHPRSFWQVDGHYLVAKCYEREGQGEQAMRWYEMYLHEYPNHIWAHQAAKNMSNLQAQYVQ